MANPKLKVVPPTEAQCKATLNSVADALYVIGGKWKLRIIVSLKDGNRRFNEMQRSEWSFPTQRLLTKT